MKNLLQNKILLILSLFILCFFGLCVTNVNAADITCNNLTFTIPDNISNYLLGNYDHGGYLLLVPDSPTAVFKNSSISSNAYGIMCYTDNSFTELCPFDSYYLSSGTDFTSSSVSLTENVTTNRTFLKTDPFIVSYFDVYASDGTIFFQRPPLTMTQTLVEETTKAQVMEQMKTTIVGFLKYLIVLVVSLLAFWKGWKFLSTQLKKA